jgi:hypothetical protein
MHRAHHNSQVLGLCTANVTYYPVVVVCYSQEDPQQMVCAALLVPQQSSLWVLLANMYHCDSDQHRDGDTPQLLHWCTVLMESLTHLRY